MLENILDETIKSSDIRAPIMLDPISFFYDKGQPENHLRVAGRISEVRNEKLKTGRRQNTTRTRPK
jgi:hypothetical protein